MSKRTLWMSFALIVACETPTTTKSSTGETGTVGPTDCATPFEGPVMIEEAGVTCDTPDQVTFNMRTAGLTSGGLVFSQETANAEPQWSDEHDLNSIDFDGECGSFDELAVTLATGAGANDWEVNASTLFRCDTDGTDPYHHNADVMSYAFRVYDLDQVLADCVVGGDDPDGLLDGTYARQLDPFMPAELAACEIVILSY